MPMNHPEIAEVRGSTRIHPDPGGRIDYLFELRRIPLSFEKGPDFGTTFSNRPGQWDRETNRRGICSRPKGRSTRNRQVSMDLPRPPPEFWDHLYTSTGETMNGVGDTVPVA